MTPMVVLVEDRLDIDPLHPLATMIRWSRSRYIGQPHPAIPRTTHTVTQ